MAATLAATPGRGVRDARQSYSLAAIVLQSDDLMREPSPHAGRWATRRPPWLGAALIAAASLAAGVASAEPARWVIDPGNSSIGFHANHIGYKDVLGLFLEERGSFTFDEETQELADLVYEVEAASVFTDNPARNEHLLSDDFLAAEDHPLIRFVMTEALPETATTGAIRGDLTIRGVTRPVEVAVTLNRIAPYPWGGNYVLGVSAEAVVRRSEFGSTYALEGGLVGDEIFLSFEIEAIRQD